MSSLNYLLEIHFIINNILPLWPFLPIQTFTKRDKNILCVFSQKDQTITDGCLSSFVKFILILLESHLFDYSPRFSD